MTKHKVEWRDIPGHEGEYQVSNFGEVRSLDRTILVVASRRCSAFKKKIRGRILRPGRMPHGHQSVVLGRASGSQCVHALVMRAFVGPVPLNQEVRHMDGDPTNNHLANLRYGTRAQNNTDKTVHGRNRLTHDQADEIRAAREAGRTMPDIAAQWGINPGQVWHICAGTQYVRPEL